MSGATLSGFFSLNSLKIIKIQQKRFHYANLIAGICELGCTAMKKPNELDATDNFNSLLLVTESWEITNFHHNLLFWPGTLCFDFKYVSHQNNFGQMETKYAAMYHQWKPRFWKSSDVICSSIEWFTSFVRVHWHEVLHIVHLDSFTFANTKQQINCSKQGNCEYSFKWPANAIA